MKSDDPGGQEWETPGPSPRLRATFTSALPSSPPEQVDDDETLYAVPYRARFHDDEPELDPALVERGRELSAREQALAAETQALIDEIHALPAEDQERPEVQEAPEQLRVAQIERSA